MRQRPVNKGCNEDMGKVGKGIKQKILENYFNQCLTFGSKRRKLGISIRNGNANATETKREDVLKMLIRLLMKQK